MDALPCVALITWPMCTYILVHLCEDPDQASHAHKHIHLQIYSALCLPHRHTLATCAFLRTNISGNKSHAPLENARDRERFAKRMIPCIRLQWRRGPPCTCPPRNHGRLPMLQRPIALPGKAGTCSRLPTLRLRYTFRCRTSATATHFSICQ
jgi:hypothetical protein